MLNKPEIPVVPTNVSDFNNDAGYLTQHQDISGKEDAMSIVNVPAGTATLSTEVGKYYTFTDAVETMNITLPSPTDVTKVRSIVFYLTTGVTPSITFNSAVPVYYHNGFQLEAVKTYEVNALFNGIAWVVTVVEIFVPVTVVAKYNVTSTSEPTLLRTSYESNIFKSMEIDGVMLDELVTEYTFDTTGVHTVKYELYDETKLGNNGPVFNSGNLIECIIPNTVTNIGIAAFVGCRGLTNITIPNSVTTISNFAFQGCTGLTSIVIGNGTETIGQGVFQDCSKLTSIDISDSVTSIGARAFSSCRGLTSCTIGSGVTSIGNNAFYGCSGLTSIVSNATIAPTISNDTFYNVKTGGTLTVPAGSTGYDVWMDTGDYYLGKSNWTKVEQ